MLLDIPPLLAVDDDTACFAKKSPITRSNNKRLLSEELLVTIHDSARAQLLRNAQRLTLCAFSLRRLSNHCDRGDSFCWWSALILALLNWRRRAGSRSKREKLLHDTTRS